MIAVVVSCICVTIIVFWDVDDNVVISCVLYVFYVRAFSCYGFLSGLMSLNGNAFCDSFSSYALYNPYVPYDASFRAYAFHHIHINHLHSDCDVHGFHDVYDVHGDHAYDASNDDHDANDNAFIPPTYFYLTICFPPPYYYSQFHQTDTVVVVAAPNPVASTENSASVIASDTNTDNIVDIDKKTAYKFAHK